MGWARIDRAWGRLLAALAGLVLASCVFEPPPAAPYVITFPPGDSIPVSGLVESSSKKVFEEPGNLVVFHGLGCAVSPRHSPSSHRMTS